MDSRIRCEMSQSESLIMEYLWKNDEGKCFSEIMEYLEEADDQYVYQAFD